MTRRLREAHRAAIDQLLPRRSRWHRLPGYVRSVRLAHNVVGVGLGPKRRGELLLDEPAVRVYVEHKVPAQLVPLRERVPAQIGGVATDVIAIGRLHAFDGPPSAKRRPATPGDSVSFAYPGYRGLLERTSGTFGALVATASGRSAILSNNHVLAGENAISIGSAIYQPGLLDGGDRDTDQIATLTTFVPLDFDGMNQVDAAIAEAIDPKLVRASFDTPKPHLRSNRPGSAKAGMRVAKLGAKTGYTTGIVSDAHFTGPVQYDRNGGVLQFESQMLITSDVGDFSAEGDSGSVVVDVDSGRAVGLVIGGSAECTIASPITAALSKLEVTLIVG